MAGQLDQVGHIAQLEQQPRQALQRAAAHADAAGVHNLVAVDLYQRGARAHRHDHDGVGLDGILGAQAVALKLPHLAGGQAIDGRVDVAAAHAGEHHMLHVAQRDAVVVEILAEGSKQRGDGVAGVDKHGRDHFVVVQAHNLGGAAAHIDAYDKSHKTNVCM